MKKGIVLLNFGEPERPDLDAAVPFLEAIFSANFRLEHAADAEAGRRRARQLAQRRAPALVGDYRRMGPSPLRKQTEMQARALDVELRQRGSAATVAIGMQFASPFIEEAADTLRAGGADLIVALPLYPLCGPSTTVFALDALHRVLGDMMWDPEVVEISGWHRHPSYTTIRARAVRMYCEEQGLDLYDSSTRLVFSAHGTPMHYLREGSRYALYVRDHCERLAEQLGVSEYVLGFQNHENRPGIEWTMPEIASVIRSADADRLIVVPVSFMHEQSETLVELDLDLRRRAEKIGLDFYRVPIPFDDPSFVSMLADLIIDASSSGRRPCRCRPGAFCLNEDV